MHKMSNEQRTNPHQIAYCMTSHYAEKWLTRAVQYYIITMPVFSVVTHADYSCGSKVFSGVCASVCLCVSPQDNSKTNDPKVFKFGIGNDLGISYLKSQGHRVTKCKNAIEWPAWVMHSIKCPASSSSFTVPYEHWLCCAVHTVTWHVGDGDVYGDVWRMSLNYFRHCSRTSAHTLVHLAASIHLSFVTFACSAGDSYSGWLLNRRQLTAGHLQIPCTDIRRLATNLG